MIGLDTNVLVRLLVQDDPTQAKRVEAFIDTLSPEQPGFVSHVTLVELVWVLSLRYRYSRAQVSHALELLLRAFALRIEQSDVVWSVVKAFRDSRADFADLLTERVCAAAGCSYTLTFDKDSAKLTGMRLLS